MRKVSVVAASLAALIAVGLTGSNAKAATSWTTPSGSSDNITYENGQTQNGLFEGGSPIVGPDAFVFTPSSFSADTESTSSVSDLLSVVLHAKAGKSLQRVSAGIKGDFSTLGPATVDAEAQLKITNLDTSEVLTQSLDFGDSFAPGKEEGEFDGFAFILLPSDWRNALVEYSASLNAFSTGGAGFIQTKTAQLAIDVQPVAVPLPGAALAAIPAIGMAWIARRRLKGR